MLYCRCIPPADARRASRQAQHSREAALLAHEKASQLIEQEHNEARGLGIGVLDLHGLHASEAVAAVDRRCSPFTAVLHHMHPYLLLCIKLPECGLLVKSTGCWSYGALLMQTAGHRPIYAVSQWQG